MKLIPVKSIRNQKMNIDLDGNMLALNITFSNLGSWFMSLDYNGSTKINGIKLSSGVFHIKSNNLPFDFTVKAEGGLDPYKLDDFLQRCKLYIIEKSEVEALRDTEIRA